MRERTRYEALQADAWRLPRDRLGELQERLRAIQQGAHAQLDAADAALGDVVAPLPDDALRFHEVLLAYFLGTSGLHAFVRSAVSTQAFALAPLSSGELSAQMIAPLANELRSASRLRVILPNELAMHDFHALELDGQPLAQRFDVVYVLDVPVREAAPTERSTRDLIVANADGTLPGSEREGRSVQDSLPAAELWNGDVAKRAKVREALPNLHRFHFAGHARYAGVDGIDSSLLLADGELSVGELLTLGSGPELVVLSACEAARGADSGPVVGLGLVQAFIAAGARSVIAAPRPTNDQASREFFELYYRALSEPGAQDLPVRAWRRASLQLFARGRPDWAAYRFFVP
jgi:CHAT domain-containing protein